MNVRNHEFGPIWKLWKCCKNNDHRENAKHIMSLHHAKICPGDGNSIHKTLSLR